MPGLYIALFLASVLIGMALADGMKGVSLESIRRLFTHIIGHRRHRRRGRRD